jgi:hypothetical protein
MDFRYYHCSHIGVDKVTGDLELLAENVEPSVAPDEPDQGDVAIRNVPNVLTAKSALKVTYVLTLPGYRCHESCHLRVKLIFYT